MLAARTETDSPRQMNSKVVTNGLVRVVKDIGFGMGCLDELKTLILSAGPGLITDNLTRLSYGVSWLKITVDL